MENQTEPLYANINVNIKDRATLYATESKLAGIKKTANLKSLIEVALEDYMMRNPIRAKQEETQELVE